MPELNLLFILSQIFVGIAIITDFAGFQFKDRKKTMIFFAVSSLLISIHYFLLGKPSAGLICGISVLRFITSYFTTDKRALLLFILLNTISLFFTFKEWIDIIFYFGIILGILATFQNQNNNKLMRILMMLGTTMVIIYNLLIISPMAVITESIFLTSNLIGYYRFYIKEKK